MLCYRKRCEEVHILKVVDFPRFFQPLNRQLLKRYEISLFGGFPLFL